MHEIIGYKHISGISKSKNEPYDLEILYCVGSALANSKDSYGHEVETVIINRLRYPGECKYPIVGDKIRVLYTRNGYAYDYDIV